MTAEELAETRGRDRRARRARRRARRRAAQGIDADDGRGVPRQRADDGRRRRPRSSSTACAAGEWRILVGDDAKRLDERVRADPLVGVRARRHRAHVPGRHRLSQALVAELRAALAPDRVRDGRDRAVAVPPRRVEHARASPAVVCFPLDTAEVQACVRGRASPRRAVRRPRRRAPAWPAARCRSTEPVVIVTTKMNRVLSVDADERVGVGRAGRAQPRPHARGRRRTACTSRPTRAASRRARSAATSPTTPAGRTAWPTASPAPTSSPSRSCCPTASVAVLGGEDPEPAGLRPARRVRRQRGDARHRHADLRAAHAEPAGGAHDAARLRRRSTTAPPTVSGDHRRRASCRRRWR